MSAQYEKPQRGNQGGDSKRSTKSGDQGKGQGSQRSPGQGQQAHDREQDQETQDDDTSRRRSQGT